MLDNFFYFIDKATCSYTTTAAAANELMDKGFVQLNLNEEWNVVKGGKYFVNIYGSSLVAFVVGGSFGYHDRINIAAAHTDQPGFVIKPNPEMKNGKYLKINVEAYGGAILNTWLDRPLGIAGCVVCRGKDVFSPVTHIVDSKKPVLVIPNMAIHFNRDVNKGVELNKQRDMIPMAAVVEEKFEKENYIINYLAELIGEKTEDILDYQLYLYNCEKAMVTGFDEKILMAPRIDNLVSVFACVKGICTKKQNQHNLNMIAVFDNEEVGSRSKQGAGSDILKQIVHRIFMCLGHSDENMESRISDGFFLSIDGAHAIHPNQSDKYDPTNSIYLNDGIVIKKAANQAYSTDAVSAAVVKAFCDKNNIPWKEFVNKSDMPGGSTLGAIASTKLPMRMADVGIPMLAMHSAMEIMGVSDVESLVNLVKELFRA